MWVFIGLQGMLWHIRKLWIIINTWALPACSTETETQSQQRAVESKAEVLWSLKALSAIVKSELEMYNLTFPDSDDIISIIVFNVYLRLCKFWRTFFFLLQMES